MVMTTTIFSGVEEPNPLATSHGDLPLEAIQSKEISGLGIAIGWGTLATLLAYMSLGDFVPYS